MTKSSINTKEQSHTVRVTPGDNGIRLDRFLAAAIADLSRVRIKALIQSGQVSSLDSGTGVRAYATLSEPSYPVKSGQTLRLIVPPPVDATPEAQSAPLNVVYEDDALIVVDKPAGLVVHPAPGNPDRTLVNALLAHCGNSLSGIGGVRRPGIVHRLDKDTSGILVVAKTDVAHQALARQFADHTIERAYTAVVWGQLRPPIGKITGNIGRDPKHRRKQAMVTRGGKSATTHYRVIRTLGAAVSVVNCQLETGRTHQIRVHMAALGHPVLGDPLYGGRQPRKGASSAGIEALKSFNRQALHARVLGFDHPLSGEHLKFEAEPPDIMLKLMSNFDQS